MKSVGIALAITSLLLLGLSSLPLSGSANNDTIVIFVNNSVSVKTLSTGDVKRLFLKQRRTLPDGSKAVPVNAKAGSALRMAFLKKILEMDASEEIRYWQVQKIKSGITPPPEFGNTQKAVYSLKGGIGYCFESEHISTVNKVVIRL